MSHQRITQFKRFTARHDRCDPHSEFRAPFDVHTNAYFDGVEYPSYASEDSTCTLDGSPELLHEPHHGLSEELSRSQRRLVKLEEELAAYKGQVTGWRNRCCIAEDALQNRQQDHERLLTDVGILKQRLETVQRMTESQEISVRSLSSKVEIMSTLALALSAISICLVLSGIHK
eukprot:g731.t1